MKKILILVVIICFLPGYIRAETSMEQALEAAGIAVDSAALARSAAAEALVNGEFQPGLSGNYFWDWGGGNRYEGGFANDLLHGYGVMYWSNGDRYEGKWVNNTREGHGVCYYAGGDRYEGNWAGNKRNGFGVYYLVGGARKAGEWQEGVFVNEYTPPAAPNLLSPSNAAVEESLTPVLGTGEFQDEDPYDFHTKTDWQISSSMDFSSSILYQQSTRHLTLLTVPFQTLEENTTYYWRARFYDSFDNVSDWSSPFSFTTIQTLTDTNNNGIPDHLENMTVDLNSDGIPDIQQTDVIMSLNTVVGNGQMGISAPDSTTVTELVSINSIDPNDISEFARPHTMPLGMLSFRVQVENPGDTAHVTVYFSQAAPENASWMYHDSISGWTDYSSYVTFSQDRMSAVVELKDGGHGDADGVENGIITDPSGFGIGSWLKGQITDAANSTGISNAAISFSGIDLNLATLSDGQFLTLLLPGTYDLAVSKPGYESSSMQSVYVSEADVLTRNISLTGRAKITGLQVTGTPSLTDSVTYSVSAQSGSSAISYRYSIHPGYGTPDYTGLNWHGMTDSEYQASSACDYTFEARGKSIVVVWATSADTSTAVDPSGIPLIGWSVDAGSSACKIHFTDVDITGEQKVNEELSFTVNAVNTCNSSLYYRFSMHPYYGTSGYDGNQWQSMTDTEWLSSNSIDYTFTRADKYVIVVWVADDPDNYDRTKDPVIGWTVDIE